MSEKMVGAVQDSGNRTELVKGGALRDIQNENGRCDLLPLSVVAGLIEAESDGKGARQVASALRDINCYIRMGDTKYLQKAIIDVGLLFDNGIVGCILQASKRYREGAEKYSERNWEKGLPIYSFIDSGTRHLLKLYREDTDEDHYGAFVWNMLGAIWTHENKPELIGNLPFNKKNESGSE